jgi:flagellar basal-body rod protein FlgB
MSFAQALDGYLGTLPQHLAHRARRHAAIAANIANVDTPGYKAADVSFSAALANAAGRGMTRTNPMHLSGRHASSGGSSVYTLDGEARRDGNNVNIDHEMVKLAENQIEYQFLARRLGAKFARLKEAISGRVSG